MRVGPFIIARRYTYQHSKHAPVLRKALLALQGNKIGAVMLLKELERGWKPANPNDRVSRQALEEFAAGRESKKPAALAALWDFLRAHEIYREYVDEVAELAPDVELLGKVIATFLRIPPVAVWTLSPRDTRTGFLGEFLMFYPEFGNPNPAGLQVATLDFTAHDNGVITSFAIANPALRRWDGGVALPFGDWMCFTAGRRHDDAVPGLEEGIHIGVIDAAERMGSGDPTVKSFKGALFRTDGPVLFPFIKFHPPVRFFCRRRNFKPDWPLMEAGVVESLSGLDYEKELRALLQPAEPR